MDYVVHCHEEKDGRLIERVTKQDFMDAITICTRHTEAKFFKIFSLEWPTHHLEGEVLPNNHIDWVRVE